MVQRQLEDLFLERLWERWLLQVQRVIRCGLACDKSERFGIARSECRAANRAAWAALNSLERVIGSSSATDAFAIGVKLAIWRHWFDPGDALEKSGDPCLVLVRSAYRSAAQMCGVDFANMIRSAEAAAMRPESAGIAAPADLAGPVSNHEIRSGFPIVRVF